MKKFLIFICILLLCAMFVLILKQNKMEKVLFGVDTTSVTNSNLAQPTSVSKTPNKELFGEWTWVSLVDMSGETIVPLDSSKFILTLTAEGKLTSTTDCNVLSGSFVTKEEIVSVGPLVSTEMACSGETMESIYASHLALISSYTITENNITFQLLKDTGVLSFSKK